MESQRYWLITTAYAIEGNTEFKTYVITVSPMKWLADAIQPSISVIFSTPLTDSEYQQLKEIYPEDD